MFDFSKCCLDDAEIKSVELKKTQLRVVYKDWQEQERELLFEEVAGYQWFSPEGKSLSHGVVEHEDAFLNLACEIAEEDSAAGFKVYSFVSAWNETKILRVVAKNVDML